MEKIFRHFKGGYYRFVTEVTNSETQEKEVVYQALYGEHKVWTRPADMFYGKVNVDGVEINRFTEVVGVPVLFKKRLTRTRSCHPRRMTMISAMTAMLFQRKRLRLMYGSTASDLHCRLKTAISLLIFQDASRSALALLYGRLAWFSVAQKQPLMMVLLERFLPYSISSCQTCHDTMLAIKSCNFTLKLVTTSCL